MGILVFEGTGISLGFKLAKAVISLEVAAFVGYGLLSVVFC